MFGTNLWSVGEGVGRIKHEIKNLSKAKLINSARIGEQSLKLVIPGLRPHGGGSAYFCSQTSFHFTCSGWRHVHLNLLLLV